MLDAGLAIDVAMPTTAIQCAPADISTSMTSPESSIEQRDPRRERTTFSTFG
jgi:hypothetical protein